MIEVFVCDEMIKLRKWLDEQEIYWWDNSEDMSSVYEDCQICRTLFYIDKDLFSVINGFRTYGGKRFLSDVNRGYLEMMYSGKVVGFLAAEDVIEMIKEKQ